MDPQGVSLVELIFSITLGVTATAMVVPLALGAVDDMRTAMAARYMASRICAARLDAVRSSRASALRFQPDGGDYVFGAFADGNGNGVRSADISSGVDAAQGPVERLADRFPGVRFELAAGVPDVDGAPGGSEDGVRIGSAQILTMSSDGTATSGTLYIRGRRGQYAVRVMGVTGRTRMLQYQPGNRSWISR